MDNAEQGWTRDGEHLVIKIPFPTGDNPKLAAEEKIQQLVNHASTLFELTEIITVVYEQQKVSEKELFDVLFMSSKLGSAIVRSIETTLLEYDVFKE